MALQCKQSVSFYFHIIESVEILYLEHYSTKYFLLGIAFRLILNLYMISHCMSSDFPRLLYIP